MANTSKIRGFIPVKHVSGAPYNGQSNLYAVAAADGTALFIGDPVKLDGSGNVGGIATVTKATAGASVLGVIVGIVPAKMDPVIGAMSAGAIALDTPQYRVASTAAYVLVADAADLLYEVEAVTGANAVVAMAAADIGLNADLATVAGSTTTGVSAAALDMSTKATTATLQFKIVGTVQRVDNDSTGNNTKVLVKINNAVMGGGTGATGQ
jgi:hypothetical protein